MADFEWKDNGLERFIRNTIFLEDTNARVGIVGDAGGRSAGTGGMSIAEVALYAEFGTPHEPARSFIRSAIRTRRAKELTIMLAEACLNFSSNIDKELHIAGAALAQVMRDKILEGSTRRNAPATVKRKGYNHPLYETGALSESLGYELVRSGGEVVEARAESEGGGEGDGG